MNVFKTINDISIQIKRIKSTTEPHAAVRVEQGKAQYVTETPKPNGYFDCVEISEWMSIEKMADYCASI